jgi:phospholipid/cholesterol/gamma-HCH transport system substrate-binding protein
MVDFASLNPPYGEGSMRDQIAETLVGAVVLAVAAAFLAYSLTAAERGAGGAGYPLTARFGSVDGLATGADVRLSGVKVGSVSGIRLDPATYAAVVTFTVDEEVQIPTDSSASLKNEGLLGGVFLEIEPGADETMIQAGGELEYGQGAIDVIRLLSEFVTRRDDGGQNQ